MRRRIKGSDELGKPSCPFVDSMFGVEIILLDSSQQRDIIEVMVFGQKGIGRDAEQVLVIISVVRPGPLTVFVSMFGRQFMKQVLFAFTINS